VPALKSRLVTFTLTQPPSDLPLSAAANQEIGENRFVVAGNAGDSATNARNRG
jgi:hypothetical protein